MPLFLLSLKAYLENVARLEIEPDAQFHLTLKNPSSDETRDVVISTEELKPLASSRGTAHFTMKWDKSSKVTSHFFTLSNLTHWVQIEATLTALQVKSVTRILTSDDSEVFVPVIGFECRGLEPIEFHPKSGFTIESLGGKVWEDVDLSDLDWCDYDEEAGFPVGVYVTVSRFDLHKK